MADTAYRQCDCGEDCYIRDFEEEEREGKCWGRVNVIDKIESEDDHSWVHACEGHRDLYEVGKYREATNAESGGN